jgi:hypothetical protein
MELGRTIEGRKTRAENARCSERSKFGFAEIRVLRVKSGPSVSRLSIACNAGEYANRRCGLGADRLLIRE